MPVKTRQLPGNITIFLTLILFLSSVVFGLSKFFADSQASVETAVDSRYQNPQVALSQSLQSSDKWETYENKAYNYQIKYPKQWPASSSKTDADDLNTYTRFLSSKVSLKVKVAQKKPDLTGKNITINDNTFTLNTKIYNKRSAFTENNNLFYTIVLTEENYFLDEQDLEKNFIKILKTFDFLK